MQLTSVLKNGLLYMNFNKHPFNKQVSSLEYLCFVRAAIAELLFSQIYAVSDVDLPMRTHRPLRDPRLVSALVATNTQVTGARLVLIHSRHTGSFLQYTLNLKRQSIILQ